MTGRSDDHHLRVQLLKLADLELASKGKLDMQELHKLAKPGVVLSRCLSYSLNVCRTLCVSYTVAILAQASHMQLQEVHLKGYSWRDTEMAMSAYKRGEVTLYPPGRAWAGRRMF
jgi:hypothetical protein